MPAKKSKSEVGKYCLIFSTGWGGYRCFLVILHLAGDVSFRAPFCKWEIITRADSRCSRDVYRHADGVPMIVSFIFSYFMGLSIGSQHKMSDTEI